MQPNKLLFGYVQATEQAKMEITISLCNLVGILLCYLV